MINFITAKIQYNKKILIKLNHKKDQGSWLNKSITLIYFSQHSFIFNENYCSVAVAIK